MKKHTTKYILFFAGIILLLMVSQLSLWIQKSVLDATAFTSTTRNVLLKNSSRDAMAEIITDHIFTAQPTLKMLVGNHLTTQVSKLLGSDLAANNIERLTKNAHLIITSPRRSPLVLNLSSIKTAITAIQNVSGEKSIKGVAISPNSIPDEIVIIDTSRLPNIHRITIVIYWLGLLSILIALGLMGYWIKLGGIKVLYKRAIISLSLIVISAVKLLLLVVLLEPVVVSTGHDISTQVLLRNIYSAFTSSLVSQSFIIILGTAVTFGAFMLWYKIIRKYTVKINIEKTID